ncbi:hypothetical protein CEXT_292681 [Caerostris extrusa]|uniref:Uncharacterized protein n=1 Tax=Caerostris extrusa TaxID=172846 RepID=A0AAV4WBL8_CAEEX|nr:hypothetical protein CEXT_292681 [Caerostris extrusa]
MPHFGFPHDCLHSQIHPRQPISAIRHCRLWHFAHSYRILSFCFNPPLSPSLVRMARNAPIILERPGPVNYAADAHISNNPNVRKMARSSNAQSPELWEREYSRNFPNREVFEMSMSVEFGKMWD